MIQTDLGDRGRSAAPLKMSGGLRSLHVKSVTYKVSATHDRAASLYEGGTRTAVSQKRDLGLVEFTSKGRTSIRQVDAIATSRE